MNYRHSFHAGNFADVFKHALLTRILSYLCQKPSAIFYLDTHAGAALYNLEAEAALRSPEWIAGVGRLVNAELPEAAAELLAPYLKIAMEGRSGDKMLSYPGSPIFAQRLLRDNDRIVLCELHPVDAELVQENMGRDRRVKFRTGDGYQSLNPLLPPPERRGLVLIDPPFEKPSEWQDIATGINLSLKKWPTGCYAIWYPIKHGNEGRELAAALDQSQMRSMLCAELLVAEPNKPGKHDRRGLAGSGLLMINPPFVLAAESEIILPALSDLLSQGENSWRADWLKQS
eukprot:gene7348-7416_t